MAIHVQCPQCGHAYEFRNQLAGQQIDCRCGSVLSIPSGPAASETPTPAGSTPSVEQARKAGSPTIFRAALALAAIAALVVVAVVAFRTWGRGAAKPPDEPEGSLPGYASPEEAFQAEKEAVARKDWKAALGVLAPQSRDRMVGWWALGAVEVARVDPETRGLLARHGVDVEGELKQGPAAIPMELLDPTRLLDPTAWLEPKKLLDPKTLLNPQGLKEAIRKTDERSQRLAAAIRDKPEFYAELRNRLEAVGAKWEGKAGLAKIVPAKLLADGQLTDVVIRGDTATGQQSFSFWGRSIRLPIHFQRIEGRWYKSLAPALLGGAEPETAGK